MSSKLTTEHIDNLKEEDDANAKTKKTNFHESDDCIEKEIENLLNQNETLTTTSSSSGKNNNNNNNNIDIEKDTKNDNQNVAAATLPTKRATVVRKIINVKGRLKEAGVAEKVAKLLHQRSKERKKNIKKESKKVIVSMATADANATASVVAAAAAAQSQSLTNIGNTTISRIVKPSAGLSSTSETTPKKLPQKILSVPKITITSPPATENNNNCRIFDYSPTSSSTTTSNQNQRLEDVKRVLCRQILIRKSADATLLKSQINTPSQSTLSQSPTTSSSKPKQIINPTNLLLPPGSKIIARKIISHNQSGNSCNQSSLINSSINNNIITTKKLPVKEKSINLKLPTRSSLSPQPSQQPLQQQQQQSQQLLKLTNYLTPPRPKIIVKNINSLTTIATTTTTPTSPNFPSPKLPTIKVREFHTISASTSSTIFSTTTSSLLSTAIAPSSISAATLPTTTIEYYNSFPQQQQQLNTLSVLSPTINPLRHVRPVKRYNISNVHQLPAGAIIRPLRGQFPSPYIMPTPTPTTTTVSPSTHYPISSPSMISSSNPNLIVIKENPTPSIIASTSTSNASNINSKDDENTMKKLPVKPQPIYRKRIIVNSPSKSSTTSTTTLIANLTPATTSQIDTKLLITVPNNTTIITIPKSVDSNITTSEISETTVVEQQKSINIDRDKEIIKTKQQSVEKVISEAEEEEKTKNVLNILMPIDDESEQQEEETLNNIIIPSYSTSTSKTQLTAKTSDDLQQQPKEISSITKLNSASTTTETETTSENVSHVSHIVRRKPKILENKLLNSDEKIDVTKLPLTGYKVSGKDLKILYPFPVPLEEINAKASTTNKLPSTTTPTTLIKKKRLLLPNANLKLTTKADIANLAKKVVQNIGKSPKNNSLIIRETTKSTTTLPKRTTTTTTTATMVQTTTRTTLPAATTASMIQTTTLPAATTASMVQTTTTTLPAATTVSMVQTTLPVVTTTTTTFQTATTTTITLEAVATTTTTTTTTNKTKSTAIATTPTTNKTPSKITDEQQQQQHLSTTFTIKTEAISTSSDDDNDKDDHHDYNDDNKKLLSSSTPKRLKHEIPKASLTKSKKKPFNVEFLTEEDKRLRQKIFDFCIVKEEPVSPLKELPTTVITIDDSFEHSSEEDIDAVDFLASLSFENKNNTISKVMENSKENLQNSRKIETKVINQNIEIPLTPTETIVTSVETSLNSTESLQNSPLIKTKPLIKNTLMETTVTSSEDSFNSIESLQDSSKMETKSSTKKSAMKTTVTSMETSLNLTESLQNSPKIKTKSLTETSEIQNISMETTIESTESLQSSPKTETKPISKNPDIPITDMESAEISMEISLNSSKSLQNSPNKKTNTSNANVKIPITAMEIAEISMETLSNSTKKLQSSPKIKTKPITEDATMETAVTSTENLQNSPKTKTKPQNTENLKSDMKNSTTGITENAMENEDKNEVEKKRDEKSTNSKIVEVLEIQQDTKNSQSEVKIPAAAAVVAATKPDEPIQESSKPHVPRKRIGIRNAPINLVQRKNPKLQTNQKVKKIITAKTENVIEEKNKVTTLKEQQKNVVEEKNQIVDQIAKTSQIYNVISSASSPSPSLSSSSSSSSSNVIKINSNDKNELDFIQNQNIANDKLSTTLHDEQQQQHQHQLLQDETIQNDLDILATLSVAQKPLQVDHQSKISSSSSSARTNTISSSSTSSLPLLPIPAVGSIIDLNAYGVKQFDTKNAKINFIDNKTYEKLVADADLIYDIEKTDDTNDDIAVTLKNQNETKMEMEMKQSSNKIKTIAKKNFEKEENIKNTNWDTITTIITNTSNIASIPMINSNSTITAGTSTSSDTINNSTLITNNPTTITTKPTNIITKCTSISDDTTTTITNTTAIINDTTSITTATIPITTVTTISTTTSAVTTSKSTSTTTTAATTTTTPSYNTITICSSDDNDNDDDEIIPYSKSDSYDTNTKNAFIKRRRLFRKRRIAKLLSTSEESEMEADYNNEANNIDMEIETISETSSDIGIGFVEKQKQQQQQKEQEKEKLNSKIMLQLSSPKHNENIFTSPLVPLKKRWELCQQQEQQQLQKENKQNETDITDDTSPVDDDDDDNEGVDGKNYKMTNIENLKKKKNQINPKTFMGGLDKDLSSSSSPKKDENIQQKKKFDEIEQSIKNLENVETMDSNIEDNKSQKEILEDNDHPTNVQNHEKDLNPINQPIDIITTTQQFDEDIILKNKTLPLAAKLRKRGRPSKTPPHSSKKNLKNTLETESIIENFDNKIKTNASSTVNLNEIKKGRGRPKKINPNNEQSNEVLLKDSSTTDETILSNVKVKPGPGRGRGRKKSNSLSSGRRSLTPKNENFEEIPKKRSRLSIDTESDEEKPLSCFSRKSISKERDLNSKNKRGRKKSDSKRGRSLTPEQISLKDDNQKIIKKRPRLSLPPSAVEIKPEIEVAQVIDGRLKRASLLKAVSKLKTLSDELDIKKNSFNPKDFIKNLNNSNANEKTKETIFICTICGDSKHFKKEWTAIQHIKKMHADYEPNEEKSLSSSLLSSVSVSAAEPEAIALKATTSQALITTTKEETTTTTTQIPTLLDFESDGSEFILENNSDSKTSSSSSSDSICSDIECENEDINDDVTSDGEEEEESSSNKLHKKSRRSQLNITNKSLNSYKPIYTLHNKNVSAVTTQKWKNFTQENYNNEKILFSKFIPEINLTELLTTKISKLEKILPNNKISMKFTTPRKLKMFKNFGESKPGKLEWQTLQRFQATEESSNEKFIYLAAPIKFLQWIPLPNNISEQYLILSYRKGSTTTTSFVRHIEPKIKETLLLIYKINFINKSIQANLHYAIKIPCGPVNSLSFLPSGGYDVQLNRLGLVAIGSVKSSIGIYALPIEPPKTTITIGQELKIRVIQLSIAFELILDPEIEDTQCTRICWSEYLGHNHIIGAFSNGCIAFWNIEEPKENMFNINYNINNNNGKSYFTPFNCFKSEEMNIDGLALHYDTNGPRWLAVFGTSRRVCIYDIRNMSQPMIFKKEFIQHIPRCIDWNPIWETFGIGMCDVIPTHGRTIRLFNPVGVNFSYLDLANSSSGISKIHFNPWQNLTAYITDNGDIGIVNTIELNLDTQSRPRDQAVSIMDLKRIDSNELLVSGIGIRNNYTIDMETKEQEKKFGIVFSTFINLTKQDYGLYRGENRNPPTNLKHHTRMNAVRWNLNALGKHFLAVGYENGFLRLCRIKEKDLF